MRAHLMAAVSGLPPPARIPTVSEVVTYFASFSLSGIVLEHVGQPIERPSSTGERDVQPHGQVQVEGANS